MIKEIMQKLPNFFVKVIAVIFFILMGLNTLLVLTKTAIFPKDYQETLQLDLSPVEFLNQTGHKEELQKIQSFLASLNFSYPEMHHQIRSLSGGQQGKLLLLNLVLRKPNFLILDEPTRNFSPTSQPEIRKLFATYPGGLITVSHDRRFLKEVCRSIYRLTEHGLEVVDLQDL